MPHEIILGHFTAHHADILVGTQMVAKGHDFPLVTLVGILLAETGAELAGLPFAGTHFPIDHPGCRKGGTERKRRTGYTANLPAGALCHPGCIHNMTLPSFYDFEISQRQRLHYPPFIRLAR